MTETMPQPSATEGADFAERGPETPAAANGGLLVLAPLRLEANAVRRGLRELIDIARVDGRPAFIFVNNRLEGNSPGTIVSITD